MVNVFFILKMAFLSWIFRWTDFPWRFLSEFKLIGRVL